mmetsp:Transcript_81751/g.144804  ORF Transcript_81751/g.144804 Transcript_81751/m.144804 type:complete len:85 (-) Transcript_81751:713-967(-)
MYVYDVAINWDAHLLNSVVMCTIGVKNVKANIVSRHDAWKQMKNPTINDMTFAKNELIIILMGEIACLKSLLRREFSCPVMALS